MNQDNLSNKRRLSLAGKLNAIGLIVFAAAIIIEIIGGTENYPTIPPGVILSLVVAGLVVFGIRWRWTTIIGALFPLWLLIGGVLNFSGWVELFTHPSAIVVGGATIQLLGLALALVSGIVAAIMVYRT